MKLPNEKIAYYLISILIILLSLINLASSTNKLKTNKYKENLIFNNNSGNSSIFIKNNSSNLQSVRVQNDSSEDKLFPNLSRLQEHDLFNRFYYVKTIKCKDSRCHEPFGKCYKDNICKCYKGYANKKLFKKGLYCSYKQKSQSLAIILEMFFIIGGNIYLGFHLYSIIKLISIIVFMTIFMCELPCMLFGLQSLFKGNFCCDCFHTGTIIVSIFIISIWQMTDLIQIIKYNATDSYGVPLLFLDYM